MPHADTIQGLRHFEVPIAVHIATEPFTMENGCLTKTSKLCRHAIRARYKDEITLLLDRTAQADEETGERRGGIIQSVLRKCLDGAGPGAVYGVTAILIG